MRSHAVTPPKDRRSAVIPGFLTSSVLLLCSLGGASGAEPAASFEIPGYAFDRGNAQTFTSNWADAEPMIGNGGTMPNVVEYDIPFPVAADYTIRIKYAAASARPVDLSLDKKGLGQVCRTANGTWMTGGAKWEESLNLHVAAGKHTLKLECPGAFPHIVALRFESGQPLPDGWKLARPKARKLDSPPPVYAHLGAGATDVKIDALRLAIEDLTATFGAKYPKGPEYLKQLDALEQRFKTLQEADAKAAGDPQERLAKVQEALQALRREALLANPLLDFDKLLLVKRGAKSPSLGMPYNWQSNSSLPQTGFDDEIAVLSPVRPEGQLATLYRPEGGRFVGDVDLNFDADRLLFSMPGKNGRWQVCEVRADGSGLRELTGEQPDVDSYDACYLPDGRIIFTSTGCFVGVPCVYGSSHVAVLYVMDADGRNIRQLCFDQEHDWCPAVMNNGRILYARWEYTDTPHSNTRLLFHMNPDGTEQMEYYKSNSYWPNSIFYARPIPHHPTKVVGIIGGHHDNPRMGELVVFDPALGRREAEGAVQRIPGYGKKVEAIIRDGLTTGSWPKFLHPYPLSEEHYLVACKPHPGALWGIYLVDTFDNFVLLKELADYALLEPVPLKKTPRPPVIPDKVDRNRQDALVYIPDIYAGGGLKGIPRGTVKQLRLFTYHYAYQGMGGLMGIVGMDGPWDIKRVVGTVPVNEDGSAKFRIPANTPLSLQPLDSEGKALQLMRSWMTAMPGEVVQCAGCHEPQNTAPPPSRQNLALNQPPAEIKPWYGPVRGFSYPREVQPVIDKYCVGCHDGKPAPGRATASNLRGDQKITDWAMITPGNGGNLGGKFSVGYAELHRYVRRPGIESDYHMLEPMEFHADSTQLVQMLKKGHYHVKLDPEAWDRLVTWIDLNCPYHGTWGEELAKPGKQRERRRELLKAYANVDDDPEAVPEAKGEPVKFVAPQSTSEAAPQAIQCAGWPMDATAAKARQAGAGPVTGRSIELADGVKIDMVLIPAGEFVMGSTTGGADERPLCKVRVERPFWMAACEVTNQQFALFDARHDSRVEDKNGYQFGIHGYPMNEPQQPVVRVTWERAMEFCRWLAQKTGEPMALPTEAQWEYACRAGTATAYSFGDLGADFSRHANVSDAKMTEFATNPYTIFEPLKNPPKYDDWIPKDSRYNDGALLTAPPGKYLPNAWGLLDMHGNAAEWTLTTYRPYPYDPADGRDAGKAEGRKVVRGGSWRDVPERCTSSFRLSYLPYQKVYNVGFRVVCPAKPAATVAAK
jgi:formylglycine-generating enzyme required for sulfatase activity